MVFFFLLRRSEYLAVDGKLSEFAVQRRDVTFADGKGNATASKQATQSVTLRIRGSKTDQLRESTRRTLHRSGSAWLCAVRAVWALVHESKKANFPDDPLCKVRDGSCVSALIVTRQLKLAAIRAGYDSKDFGTHTRRSGGATALYTGGSSDTTVKLHGWWKSECYQRYVHRPPPNWPRLCSTASGTLRNRRRLFKGVLQCMEPANNSDSPLDVECGPPFTNRNCI
ncbi:hypothetical protein JG688_00006178 [Phytophthora aleatoria]|uniref:Tyr recombinase domain-containing protein n=1 Tax=Phytophthora aleatoria TaxID=2496075 RepID=A0A8J5IYW1_9STRA|nr:hypothetical protein JG688_00006178 [Phytophthora aleatoria]